MRRVGRAGLLAAACLLGIVAGTASAATAQQPVTFRLGYGGAAEEPMWLLVARPDLAKNYGKAYTLDAIKFSSSDKRAQAFEAGAIDLSVGGANGVIFADQWNNPDNRKAHYVSTGPEIWEQTQGKVDGFICAIGTGGTIAGVSDYLREKNKNIMIGVADPKGAAMYNLFAHGRAKASEGGSITEGIGLGRVTAIIEDIKVDVPYLIPDEEAVPIIFDLLEHEGLCLGGSSGINVAGAIRLARNMGPGHVIVTILCDYGTRYQSKLFNPQFLREKRLAVPDWLERRSHIEVPYEKA